MIFIFDIDGTIIEVEDSDYENAKPMIERIAKVNELYLAGNKIIYWTARGATSGIDWFEFTKKQLKDFGCMYTEFYTKKPHYHVWVDDKAQNADDFFAERNL